MEAEAPHLAGSVTLGPRLRVVARLDVKGPSVIKGVQMEGLRVIGNPHDMAQRYYAQGADEILYVDTVASLYGRENLVRVLSDVAHDLFVPLTVVGGVRTVEDGRILLRSGADKIGVNTGALQRPELVTELADEFGSQAVVLSVEAKRRGPEHADWRAMVHAGRDDGGWDIKEWIPYAVALGAGEVLVTSVDRDGTRRGLDVDLIECVGPRCPVPLIVSGGASSLEGLAPVFTSCSVDGVAVGAALHAGQTTIGLLKGALEAGGIEVRNAHA